jgi:outer membrane lipoprotein-sorting protein
MKINRLENKLKWQSAWRKAHGIITRHAISSFRYALCAMLYALVSPAFAQQPTAAEILAHVRDRLMAIQDYTVEIHADLDMPDTKIPPMDVKVYFKQPDKLYIESEGFAMLPKQGLFINPSMFQDSLFLMMALPPDTLDGATVLPVELMPRGEDTPARKITLWVEPNHWTVEQIHTVTWDGQKITIRFTNQQVENQYWLPMKALITMSIKQFADRMKSQHVESETTEKPKPGNGTLTVEFKNYHVNKGIDDKVFEKK